MSKIAEMYLDTFEEIQLKKSKITSKQETDNIKTIYVTNEEVL